MPSKGTWLSAENFFIFRWREAAQSRGKTPAGCLGSHKSADHFVALHKVYRTRAPGHLWAHQTANSARWSFVSASDSELLPNGFVSAPYIWVRRLVIFWAQQRANVAAICERQWPSPYPSFEWTKLPVRYILLIRLIGKYISKRRLHSSCLQHV